MFKFQNLYDLSLSLSLPLSSDVISKVAFSLFLCTMKKEGGERRSLPCVWFFISSLCLSIFVSLCLSACLSVYLPVCLSVYISLSVGHSLCLACFCLSLKICQYSMSVLSVFLSIFFVCRACLSIYMSLPPSLTHTHKIIILYMIFF